MALLPGLDRAAEYEGLSEDEKKWIAACQYLVILIEVGVLGWLIYNVWNIVYKQGKYKVPSILTFYILAAMLILFRLENEIWLWCNVYEYYWITEMFPIALKFSIGFN